MRSDGRERWNGATRKCPTCRSTHKTKVKAGWKCRQCETVVNSEGKVVEERKAKAANVAGPRVIRGYVF
jgi:tRNA(Ile2) C34 agmatinyltransferase TiaS